MVSLDKFYIFYWMNIGFRCSFFMSKFNHKEGLLMFSDEILEKIFEHPESKKVPIGYQSTMIRIVEEVLTEMGVNLDATLSES